MRNSRHNKSRIFVLIIFFLLVIVIFFIVAKIINTVHPKTYSAEHFDIKTEKSDIDFDNDGIDDYTDIMQGAREFVKNRPPYKSLYYDGGYPTDGYAVCTDVIWAAMKNAGYDLKASVDFDIALNQSEYFGEDEYPDTNIDFRRVKNLKIFFTRNATSLTLDPEKIEEWLPGDIVTFSKSHIAIISDKRNKKGIPLIIHQSTSSIKEADKLTEYEIDGHFRITGDYKYGK